MFLQTLPHPVTPRALPSSSTPSPSSSAHLLLHSNNPVAIFFEYHTHRKGCGRLRGRGGNPKNARKEIELKFRVGKEGFSRNTKKGLKLGFDDGLGGFGEVECHATLKEEDLVTESQQPSNSGSAVVVPHGAAVSSMEGKPLWSKLGQSVNLSGVSFAARVIVKDRHLAIPHVSVPDIGWVDWKALKVRGFEGVLFDKDNTLTAPYGQTIWPSLTDSLEECRGVFGGRIALLSNSAGLYQYDPLGAEAKILENKLGIPVIRHGQKKPAGNALAVSHYFSCDPTMLIMVGDRYFTDVVYGNSNGMLTIRPAPLTTRGEPFVVKRVRGLEDMLVDWWHRQGCLPPKHKLFDNPVDFIKDPGCW